MNYAFQRLGVFFFCGSLTVSAVADDWGNKYIITKMPNVRFFQIEKDGAQISRGTLNGFGYRVLAKKDGLLKVRQDDLEGWLAKADAVVLEEAVAYFSERIKGNPNDPEDWGRRAAAWELMRDFEAALKDASEAVRLMPTRSSVWSNRAAAWLNKGEFDKTISDCDEAIRLDPNNASAYYSRGSAWFRKKEFDKALGEFEQVLKLHPASADAYAGRGAVWHQKKEYAKAMSDFDSAIRHDPYHVPALINRGNVSRERKEYHKAIADFNEAARLDSQLTEAYSNRGHTWFELKEYDLALKDFDNAIRLAPKLAAAYVGRGNVWDAKKNYAKAILEFDLAILIDPTDAAAYGNRARAWQMQGRHENAIKDFEASLRLMEAPWAYRDYAWLLATCPSPSYRDERKALELATKACAMNPNGWKDGDYLTVFAAAFAAMDNLSEAVRWQRLALNDPNLDPSARSNYESLLRDYEQRMLPREEPDSGSPFMSIVAVGALFLAIGAVAAMAYYMQKRRLR